METSLKTGFTQIFSCCPKNLSCPIFGGLQPPSPPPPGPYACAEVYNISTCRMKAIKLSKQTDKTYWTI